MDFKLFNINRKSYDAVLVIINRSGKRSFSLLTHKICTAAELAELYFIFPWRIFETFETITSDRNPQFIAKFSDEFSKLIGIALRKSTAKHAETNGQTEIINQFIQIKLRSFINYFQDNWSDLLPCLDFATATQSYEATNLSSSEVNLGYLPRMLFNWKARSRSPAIFRDKLS
jgi:hypothetical protein